MYNKMTIAMAIVIFVSYVSDKICFDFIKFYVSYTIEIL